jgi:hypothetical protein
MIAYIKLERLKVPNRCVTTVTHILYMGDKEIQNDYLSHNIKRHLNGTPAQGP